mgnify:CR=1 FL=1
MVASRFGTVISPRLVEMMTFTPTGRNDDLSFGVYIYDTYEYLCLVTTFFKNSKFIPPTSLANMFGAKMVL